MIFAVLLLLIFMNISVFLVFFNSLFPYILLLLLLYRQKAAVHCGGQCQQRS